MPHSGERRYGTIPYVYKSRGVATAYVVIGPVLVIAAVIFGLVALSLPQFDPVPVVCGAVFLAVGILSLYLGIGSLRGQRSDNRR